ncbi:MAG TPA: helix-turn-helix domain-containing protein [Ktedonosporobacter sp.]|nr:helix-turn-helix domain-containing protein [Ktedonosporobacter sp.]
MKVFTTHHDKILSWQWLLTQVWGTSYRSHIHCLHVSVAQLRRKLEVDPGRPSLIVTVPGVGYRFTWEQEHSA